MARSATLCVWWIWQLSRTKIELSCGQGCRYGMIMNSTASMKSSAEYPPSL
jgi:hypothetical protein